MLSSNVRLGYNIRGGGGGGGGGGQAVQGGLFPHPPPSISKRMDNQQFLLHHLLQKYLIERDISFISVGGVGGASCPGRFILPHAKHFKEN